MIRIIEKRLTTNFGYETLRKLMKILNNHYLRDGTKLSLHSFDIEKVTKCLTTARHEAFFQCLKRKNVNLIPSNY